MIRNSLRALQRGATLVVGLIMLALITLMVTTAFQLSMGNLQAVGNMQFREQALAAANYALESKIAGDLTIVTATETVDVDLNNNGVTDMVATIGPPDCVTFSLEATVPATSLPLASAMAGTGDLWNVLLELDIGVSDAVTGANIRVRSGVRVLMTTTQRNAWCT